MAFSITRQSLGKSTGILKIPSNDFINTWENRKNDLDSLGYKKRGGEAAPIIQYPGGIGKPTSTNSASISERDPILVTYGAVFIKGSWNKDRDQPVPKATWTDMVNGQWMIVAKQDTKNLKYVIRDNIQDINTKDSKEAAENDE
ncbi:hypothetical protein CH063_11848 [Colletotrichum higginsianum]|uniref:Uncharacterized protein n=1 Tax=Colletotrichum higginsianum (strain IMI 349063) TaxID=759273 RepID=H1VN15_COLHI|nr:hypothetical protein CH063_11848 [Colletotrichum higginsianum]